MQSGKNILASLDKFLIEWQAIECNIPALIQVIVPNTLACHKAQSVHFKNCMTPPADLQFELIDRFGCSVLRQGSGKNENQQAHKMAAFPKACAPAFGLAFQTAIVAGVNFDLELMYDSQWAFLPISTMHIIVTQLLATIPSQSCLDIGNSQNIDATPAVADVSTNCDGMVANNCVTMMCIVEIGKNAHCESYINSRSKFTPATIAVCNAKPKAGAHAFGNAALLCAH